LEEKEVEATFFGPGKEKRKCLALRKRGKTLILHLTKHNGLKKNLRGIYKSAKLWHRETGGGGNTMAYFIVEREAIMLVPCESRRSEKGKAALPRRKKSTLQSGRNWPAVSPQINHGEGGGGGEKEKKGLRSYKFLIGGKDG